MTSVDAPPEADALSWLVLVEAGPAGPPSAQTVRPGRIALQLGLAILLLVALVGVGGALVSKHVAEQQSVHDVAELTDVLAENVVQPALTDATPSSPAAAAAGLGRILRPGVLGPDLVRVKLWTPEGTILYSDEPRLVGQTFALDDEARSALTTPATQASLSDLGRPENQFERGQGKLLEVYRPVWTPAGHPMLLETYFRYHAVSERSHGLWRGFAGIILSSLAALVLLASPIVWSLLQRARRAQAQRHALARRAVESSDAERSRIAASLHDGIVQQLVASSFDLSARAERASVAGDRDRAADLGGAAATMRSSIAGLRSLLVELYPANLTSAGLPAALRDLAGTLTGGTAEVVLDLDDAVAAQLSPEAGEAFFRVAQETLRNSAKHAQATIISARLSAEEDWIYLDIDDDGVGFDSSSVADAAARAGHLGLQLIVEAAGQAGTQLCLATRPGFGTHYRMAARAS